MFETGMIGLFFGCFLAATIIPFFSESLVVACLVMGNDPLHILITATAGNWLGGMTNYFFGYIGNEAMLGKFLRVDAQKIHSFGDRVRRWGAWLALITWLPVVGDPLGVALGLFRVSYIKVAVLSLIARAARYTIFIYFLEISEFIYGIFS